MKEKVGVGVLIVICILIGLSLAFLSSREKPVEHQEIPIEVNPSNSGFMIK